MIKKLMFSMLLVAVVLGGFALVGVSTTHASTSSYGYSTPVCGYGGCAGYNYSVAMYPYVSVSAGAISSPTPSYAYVSGCGEGGCNSGWGNVSQYYYGQNPPVYYNPRPVYPSYYGW